MSRRQRYPWPIIVGACVEIQISGREAARAVCMAASKYAQRRGWVFRTRQHGDVVRVRRAA